MKNNFRFFHALLIAVLFAPGVLLPQLTGSFNHKYMNIDSAKALHDLGVSDYSDGDYWLAIRKWMDILPTYEKEEQWSLYVSATNNIGLSYENLYQPVLAYQYYRRAYKTALAEKYFENAETYSKNCAALLQNYAVYSEAYEYYKIKMVISRELESENYLQDSLYVLQLSDSIETAAKWLENNSASLVKTPSPSAAAFQLFLTAAKYSMWGGKYDDADKYLMKAAKLVRFADNESCIELSRISVGLEMITRVIDVELSSDVEFLQEETKYEFLLMDLTYVTPDSAVAIVAGGSQDGLFVGSSGSVSGAYFTDIEGHSAFYIAEGSVIEVGKFVSKVGIKLKKPGVEWKMVYPADFIGLKVYMPKREFGALFETATKINIAYRTLNHAPVASRFLLTRYNNPDLEKKLLEVLTEDVHKAYNRYIDYVKDYPAWDAPAESGLFMGQSMMQTLKSATLGDVATYIKYCSVYPGSWNGKNQQFPVQFATWVLGGTTIDKDITREQLHVLYKKISPKEFFDRFSDSFKDDNVIGELAGEIEDSITIHGDYATAITLLIYLDQVASFLPESWDYMKTNFELGQAYMDSKEFEKSSHHFTKARKLYLAKDYIWDAAETLHNDALNLQNQDLLVESAAMFDSAITLKRQVSAKDPSDALYETIASSLWGKAWSIRYLNQYDEAIKIYELAVIYYDSSARHSAKVGKRTVLDNIGEIYEKKGEHNRAIEHYIAMLPLIQELQDSAEEGEAYNDIGFNYFQLGDYQKSIEWYQKGYDIHTKRGSSKDAGFSTSNIAQVYWTLGKYDEAIKTHMDAIQLRESANDFSGLGYSWSKLGALYKDSGDPAKAIESFEKAVQYYEKADDVSGLADTYKELGDLYLKVKDLARAKEKLEKSLDIKRNLKDPFKLAEAYFDIGSVYYQYVDYANAEKSWKEALDLYTQIGDFSGRVYTLANIGLLEYVYHKRFNEAIKIFNDAVRLSAEVNNDNNLAYCYQRIGNLYKENGDVELSKKYIDSSYTIYKSLGDLSKVSSTLVDIGYYYMSRGEFVTADSLFRESLDMANKASNNIQIAIANQSLADMALYLGEFKKSLSILEETRAIYSKIDNFWGLASVNLGMGNVYNHMGEFKNAIHHYSIADSLYNSIDDEYSRSTPMNNIGTIYYWQGDNDAALKQFEAVKVILEKFKVKNEFYAIVEANIGEVLLEQNKFTESRRFLDSAKQRADQMNFNSLKITVLTVLGKLHMKQNKFDEALTVIKDAYELVKKSGEKDRLADVTNSLGKVYFNKKDFANALKYLEESVTVSKNIGSTRYLYQPLYTQGLIFKEKGQIENGIARLKEAIEVVESIRGKIVGGESAAKLFAAGEEKVKIYEEIISLYIQKNEIDSALIFLDRSNNEALKQQFGKIDVKFQDENKNQALQTEKDLKSRVNGIEEEIAKVKAKPEGQQNKEYLESLEKSKNVAEKEYINFITQTVKEFPNLQNYFASNVNPKSFIRSKSKIPQDVAVLAYLMGENQLYIFAASKDTVIAKVIQIGKDKVEKSVVKVYRYLKDGQIGKSLGDLDPATMKPKTAGKDLVYDSKLKPFFATTDELYQTLIEPVADVIKNKTKLSIIPYGKLYYLPFESLSSLKGNERTFLNEQYSIFYISTLDIFGNQHPDEGFEFKVMALGNADNSLPNSEREVEDLKKIYTNSAVFVRGDASEDKVKNLSAEFNAIHFATHGNLDYVDVRNSYLTLASNTGAGEDGRLTIEEVWGLSNLNEFNLVTLSACQTAVSDEIIQGWMVNPANAFFDVGVKTVIASLWQVDDEATSILMNAFYGNLKTMNKVEALSRAKLTLQKTPKYAFPYYWASFVMVGDYK